HDPAAGGEPRVTTRGDGRTDWRAVGRAPESRRDMIADGQDQHSIKTELSGFDGSHCITDRGAFGGVPESRDLIADGEYRLPVGAEGDICNFGPEGQGDAGGGADGGVPESNHPVAVASHKDSSVRTERRGRDRALMSHGPPDRTTVGGVPELC